MKRTKSQQSEHDQRVRRIAGGYKSQGYKVKADIPGYSKPRTIYGRRPDIEATRGRQSVYTEVETKASLRTDVAQRKIFRKFASLNKHRKFRTSIV